MSTYDTSRLYRSASHALEEDTAIDLPAAPPAEVERMAKAWEDRATFVAHTLRPAASAIVAYSEYLLATAELPRGQHAVLDVLRRQAQTVLWALSALAASAEADPSAEDAAATPSTEQAIA